MNTATHTGLRLATAGNGGSFSVVKGILSAAVHVKGPTASCRIVRQVHKFQKAGERDRFSCQVLGYGCHPHRGMTTVPQRTYSYLTEAITRCHHGHTHPTGSGILVYDSITSFIIQDSGVNAPKFCSTERARPFSASAPLPQMCVCPAAPLAGIPVEASTIGFFAQTRCNFAQMLCRTCALRSARLMRCGAEIC